MQKANAWTLWSLFALSFHLEARATIKAGDSIEFLSSELVIQFVSGNHVVLFNPRNQETCWTHAT